MHLIPTEAEVLSLFRQTGALRDGHFEYPGGLHSTQHVEPALVLRSYQDMKVLTVALSRLLRSHPDLRVLMPELSFVAVTPAGVPLACCLAEVLRPRQVYWALKEDVTEAMRFPQFLRPGRGEKVVLIDDILRAGVLVDEARRLLGSYGADVIALAVLVNQCTSHTVDLGALPFYPLANLTPATYPRAAECPLCLAGGQAERVLRGWKPDAVPEAAVAAL